MRAYRTDATHEPIFKALVAAGRPSLSVPHMGGLGCDIISTHIDGYPVFIECKTPGKHAKELTPSEVKMRSLFPRFYVIAQSVSEALAGVGLKGVEHG